MRFKRAIALLALAGIVLTDLFITGAQEPAGGDIKYVRGRVYNVNWAGSKLTIQWFYSTEKLADDKMTFATPDSVQVFTDKEKIFKDVRRAGISDLNVGDHVIVGYRERKKGDLEAVTIKVMEHDLPIPA
ncbi:MAG: hypothetical protein V1682_06190 [Candidatus Omnitrophota bacterium]